MNQTPNPNLSTAPGETPTRRLYSIVEQGLCIGCGICQSIAGRDVVEIKITKNGHERPIVVGELDHKTVDVIYDVCPGTRVDGLPPNLYDEETKVDNVWGPWRRIVRAWASDTRVRFEGSTGGVLTALAQYLLTSGQVDFILHTKASTTEPTFGEPTLSFTKAEVLEASGSRYGPTATLIDVEEVLSRGQPFAFIGKPCDIAALRNWARFDDRVEKLVKYWLGPVCGGFGPPSFTEDFFRRMRIEPAEVKAMRYRGRGCPGPTVVETANERVEAHYLDYWGDDESKWTLPWRCKICPDGIGESADLAAADTWPGGSPRREDTDDLGTNAIIARTLAGQQLLEAATRAGALTIESDLVPSDLSVYQPHQRRKKYAAGPRHQGLGELGRIVPATSGLRLDELAAEMPVEFVRAQVQGVKDRVSAGRVDEPSPQQRK